jgi:Mn2+/Fe2+ NRAMP family transporter
VGRRNLKYFIGFLLMTALHAAIVWALSLYTFVKDQQEAEREEIINRSIMIFAGIFGLVLFIFGMVQIFDLALSNVVSNEDLRHRWNGHILNRPYVELFRKDSSLF